MNKDLDKKIKDLLNEKDDIIVPEKISTGIDKTLKSIHQKKNNKLKKLVIAVSIAGIIIIPIGVGAYKKIQQTYVPGFGRMVETNEIIYSLEKPVSNKIGTRKTTIRNIYYNLESKTIYVYVEGNGQLPQDSATLKINNKKLKSTDTNLEKISNSDLAISWAGTYTFKYDKTYNKKDVSFEIVLSNGEKAKFKCKLTKGTQVNDIKELGPTSSSKGIAITSVIHEEKNQLDITLLSNLPRSNTFITYGQSPYTDKNEPYGTDEGILNLTDANGNTVVGKIDKNIDTGEYNRFTFDTSNLAKPFNIDIPQIQLNTNGEFVSSDIIELPIPQQDEKITLNKEILLNTIHKLFKDSDKEVKLVSIARNNNECTIELDYKNEDKEVKLTNPTIIPTGESKIADDHNYFDSGLSGSLLSNYSIEWNFILPYPDSDKLFVKILGSEYKIKGDWKLTIE